MIEGKRAKHEICIRVPVLTQLQGVSTLTLTKLFYLFLQAFSPPSLNQSQSESSVVGCGGWLHRALLREVRDLHDPVVAPPAAVVQAGHRLGAPDRDVDAPLVFEDLPSAAALQSYSATPKRPRTLQELPTSPSSHRIAPQPLLSGVHVCT